MKEPLIDRIRRLLADIYAATSRLSVDACVRNLENIQKDLDATAQSLTARAHRRYTAAVRQEKLGDEDTIQSERALRVLKRVAALTA